MMIRQEGAEYDGEEATVWYSLLCYLLITLYCYEDKILKDELNEVLASTGGR
jgi:hypothetical protein